MKAGWQTKTLGEVLQKTETVNPVQSPETEFDYIDVSSVSNTSFEVEQTQRLKGKDAPSRARKLVKTNDVIFATIRPTLRRIAIVPAHLDEQVCSTGYFVLRPKAVLDHRFVYYWLFSEEFMRQMEALQKGASYPAVTDKEVRDQVIPFPTLPEQQRIVTLLDEAFAGIATAKANAEKNLQNARAIFESFLTTVYSARNKGWIDTPLHMLCRRITVGHVGSMANLYKPTGIPFLRSQNIRPFFVSMENMVFIDYEFHTALEKSSLKSGDLAIVRTGYPGTAAVIPDSLGVANCSDLVIVRPGPEIDAHFLAAFFNSSFGKNMVSGKIVGAAQKHFNVGAAKDVLLHLPPLVEQRLIVNEIDKLREETLRLESIYQRKLAALDELKKSLLHRAFTGHLT